MQVVLLALTAFILAVDQFALTRFLNRPIVAGVLTGAVLNNIPAGAAAGAMLEIGMISYDQTDASILSTRGFVLASVMASVFACTQSMDASSAAGASVVFMLAGSYLNYIIMMINNILLVPARKAAEKGDEKGLLKANVFGLLIIGSIYAVISVICYNLASSDTVSNLITENRWVFDGLRTAAMLMPCVGIAVLMRNLGAKNMYAAVIAGAALMSVCAAAGAGPSGMVITVCIGFAAAAYDYYLNTKKTESSANKGGAQKWW